MTDKPRDKIYLEALCGVLQISKYNIRKDECGDYYFPCKQGKIFTVPGDPFWYVYYSPENARRWGNFKRKLPFLILHQDGDDEGILKADYPLSEDQSKILRKEMKIRVSRLPVFVKNGPVTDVLPDL